MKNQSQNHEQPNGHRPFPAATCSVDVFHNRLVDISIAIGGISESAAWASEGVARWIMERHPGRRIEDLTIGDILEVMAARSDFCQRIYSPNAKAQGMRAGDEL